MKTLRQIIILSIIIAFPAISDAQGTWTKKADFAGIERRHGVGFSIAEKGYFGLGDSKNDLWEYNPTKNTWTQKADYPIDHTSRCVAFVVNNLGFVGTGLNQTAGSGHDVKGFFYKYNPISNTWVAVASNPIPRQDATAFSIGNKGYVGFGGNPGETLKDLWEYDPDTDSWIKKTDPPSVFSGGFAVSFNVGNKGYLLIGIFGDGYHIAVYDPLSDTWTQKSKFPSIHTPESQFVINGKAYIKAFEELHQYDPSSDTWTRMADYPGSSRFGESFTIGCKGYYGVGTLSNNTPTKEFYEFSPDINNNVLGEDRSLCPGECITLNAGNSGFSYTWSTEQEYSSITVCEPGTYWVRVKNGNGCDFTDTIIIHQNMIDFDVDTFETHYNINAGQYQSYQWNTGQTSSNINVYSPGWYSVTVFDGICTYSDSIFINPVIPVNLGEDVNIPSGTSITLDAGYPNYNHLWSTGETTQKISVSEAGIYWVKVSNNLGWEGTDTLTLTFLTSILDNNEQSLFKIYPVPAKKQLNYTMSEIPSGGVNMIIYSATGKKVLEQRLSTMTGQIDVANLSSGVYFIEIIGQEFKETGKIAIE